jgi:hypothetical protein
VGDRGSLLVRDQCNTPEETCNSSTSLHALERATETYAQAICREQSDQPSAGVSSMPARFTAGRVLASDGAPRRARTEVMLVTSRETQRWIIPIRRRRRFREQGSASATKFAARPDQGHNRNRLSL